MVLESLIIQNIRNHTVSEFQFPDNGILLWGENGAGKTAVLESISLLCTSRSFKTTSDRSIVNKDAEECMVGGSIRSDTGSRHFIELQYGALRGRKQISLDNSKLHSSVDLIGKFPIVQLSPEYRSISTGGPRDRRAFLDFVISQLHHSYLLDLIEYRKIVKQRNALLSSSGVSVSEIQARTEPWDEQLAHLIVRIVRQRMEFVEVFGPIFRAGYDSIIVDGEVPSLQYRGTVDVDFYGSGASDNVRQQMGLQFRQDFRRGLTTIGPHRDDLEILLNGMDVRNHASQGQHKSILIALKLAEYRLLAKQLDERPLLLLDDIFGELDDRRLKRIMNLIDSVGQSFITSANRSVLRHFPKHWVDTSVIQIEHGSIVDHVQAGAL